MPIQESYRDLKKCIVAFVSKYIQVWDENDPLPQFPPIVATGFIVREDGIIATNAHVVSAFKKVMRPDDAPKDEWPVAALLFKHTDKGVVEVPLEVLGVAVIGGFQHGKAYYGPKEGPDIAFVHVKAKGLPIVQIDNDSLIEEGMEVATAGFPLGTDALTAPGWLHQITPTLQRGIISAVMPFSCPTPHAYSVNIMTQGGASGSPVFSCESGKVQGILYAGLHDLDITIKQKDLYRVPTNISYVVPSHYLSNCMKELEKNKEMVPPPDARTLERIIEEAEFVDRVEKGPGYVLKKVPEVTKPHEKVYLEKPEESEH